MTTSFVKWAYTYYTRGIGSQLSHLFNTKKEAIADRKICIDEEFATSCSKVQKVYVSIDV